MKLIKILLINIFVLFVFFEILLKIIFFHPTRFYYPISSFTKDIQQDWSEVIFSKKKVDFLANK